MEWFRNKKRYLAVSLLVFLFTFSLGILVGKYMDSDTLEQIGRLAQSKNTNILIMGIDARSMKENSRSDTIILASIDKKNEKVAMVWIPRDTRVEVQRNRYDKINAVNYTKGPEAACNIVGKLLGVKVDHYIVMNFAGFAEIIDILGGVTIDVETNMYHPDPDPMLAINLSKGLQKLDGQDALRYVRYRGGPTADIGRTGRQQKFIKALAEELFKSNTILKLPKLLPKIADNMRTNMQMKDMLSLASMGKDFGTDNLITQTLPGYSFTDPANGASYWEAKPEIADGIIKDLLAGKHFEVAQDPPGWKQHQPIIPVQAEFPGGTADSVLEDGEGKLEIDGEQIGGESDHLADDGGQLPDGETGDILTDVPETEGDNEELIDESIGPDVLIEPREIQT